MEIYRVQIRRRGKINLPLCILFASFNKILESQSRDIMRQKGCGDGLRYLRDSRMWEVEEAKFPWDLGACKENVLEAKSLPNEEVLCRFLLPFQIPWVLGYTINLLRGGWVSGYEALKEMFISLSIPIPTLEIF